MKMGDQKISNRRQHRLGVKAVCLFGVTLKGSGVLMLGKVRLSLKTVSQNKGKTAHASPCLSLKKKCFGLCIETGIYLPQRMILPYLCWNQDMAFSFLILCLAPKLSLLYLRYLAYE